MYGLFSYWCLNTDDGRSLLSIVASEKQIRKIWRNKISHNKLKKNRISCYILVNIICILNKYSHDVILWDRHFRLSIEYNVRNVQRAELLRPSYLQNLTSTSSKSVRIKTCLFGSSHLEAAATSRKSRVALAPPKPAIFKKIQTQNT